MRVRLDALLSVVVGAACVLSSFFPPFDAQSLFALGVGIGNLLMAVWLFSEAQP